MLPNNLLNNRGAPCSSWDCGTKHKQKTVEMIRNDTKYGSDEGVTMTIQVKTMWKCWVHKNEMRLLLSLVQWRVQNWSSNWCRISLFSFDKSMYCSFSAWPKVIQTQEKAFHFFHFLSGLQELQTLQEPNGSQELMKTHNLISGNLLCVSPCMWATEACKTKAFHFKWANKALPWRQVSLVWEPQDLMWSCCRSLLSVELLGWQAAPPKELRSTQSDEIGS